MNKDQVLNLTVELCMKEVNINELENKIKRHIETYIKMNSNIEEDKLILVAKMYNDLYKLKNQREKLLTKVAIGYDCIIKDDEKVKDFQVDDIHDIISDMRVNIEDEILRYLKYRNLRK